MGVLGPFLRLLGFIIVVIVTVTVLLVVIFKLVRGKKHMAEYFWEDGSNYKGEINYYGINGKGVYFSSSGDRYEGEFRKNAFDGEGAYFCADGSSYVGKFEKGEPVEGEFTDVNGNVYRYRYRYMTNGARITDEFTLIHKESEELLQGKELNIDPVRLDIKSGKN